MHGFPNSGSTQSGVRVGVGVGVLAIIVVEVRVLVIVGVFVECLDECCIYVWWYIRTILWTVDFSTSTYNILI